MESIGKKVVELNIEDVLPNRFQPRIKFNEEAINELSKSIKEHGVIQPIVVRPIGDKYEIIAGERRYKASCMAELKTIPAIITDLNDKDSAEVALIENVQRENLTPIEEAISYKKILDMGYITQDALATKLGKTQSTVANKLRLLNLDDEVQEALLNEKISERHARSLLKLNDKKEQKQMLNKIISERLTVRRADEEIDKMISGTQELFKENEQLIINPAIPVDQEQKKIFIDTPMNIEESSQPSNENDKGQQLEKFKFINIPSESNKEINEQKDSELNDNIVESPKEDLKPKKFFNILDNEDNKEDEESNKLENKSFSFENIFMNTKEDHMNPMLKELTEIENSINNSNSLPPIFQDTITHTEEQEDKSETTESNKNQQSDSLNQEEKDKILSTESQINDETEEFDDFDDDMEFIEEEDLEKLDKDNTEPVTIPEKRISNFKDVLEEVRNCSQKIEKSGFDIETEEYDLDGTYQIVFKIKNED